MTVPTRTGTRHTIDGLPADLVATLARRLALGSHTEYDPDGTVHLVWHRGTDRMGYGVIRVPRAGFAMRVHRVAYELAHGPADPALDIDHLCGRRACVLPDHLEAVTRAENHARSTAAAAALVAANDRRRREATR